MLASYEDVADVFDECKRLANKKKYAMFKNLIFIISAPGTFTSSFSAECW